MKAIKKKNFLIFIFSIVCPMLLYVLITFILAEIREDKFCAYHVYINNNHYIQYQNDLYIEITHDEQLAKINEEINGQWCNDKEVVLKDKIKFPYLEYWIPEFMFFEHIDYSKDGKYVTTYGLSGQNKMYRRLDG